MFTPQALRQIIRLSLQPITATSHPFWTPDAEEILLMIAAHESQLGKYIVQIGGGPARGVYQIEPETMQDNYDNFLNARPELKKQFATVSGYDGPDVDQLTDNPIYGTLHARLKIYRSPGAIPHDLPAMAEYAKAVFNSAGGSATAKEYLDDYYRLVFGK